MAEDTRREVVVVGNNEVVREADPRALRDYIRPIVNGELKDHPSSLLENLKSSI